MRLYNCPDCTQQHCEGCPRVALANSRRYQEKQSGSQYWELNQGYYTTLQSKSKEPDPCFSCPNNIKNGGTGICNCTLGGPKITCSSGGE